MRNYEQLGAFYLGRMYDMSEGRRKEDLLLYDAKDLTTHAVCVGMTGSGKTGLCVTLLEEAGIDVTPTWGLCCLEIRHAAHFAIRAHSISSNSHH